MNKNNDAALERKERAFQDMLTKAREQGLSFDPQANRWIIHLPGGALKIFDTSTLIDIVKVGLKCASEH